MNVLVAQAGHAGRTSGKTGTEGEQSMTLDVCRRIAATAPDGWTVRVIQADETASRYRGNAFVAVHGDGSTNRTVSGAAVGYRTSEGKAFALAWKAAYSKVWPYGWHRDNYTAALAGYYGTGQAVAVGNRRAFVLEVGMMTNRADRAWINAHHDKIAASVWAALGAKPATRYAVVGIDRLDVHASPRVKGRFGRRYGSVKKGRYVTLLDKHGADWRVRRFLLAGWVDSRYLDPVK